MSRANASSIGRSQQITMTTTWRLCVSRLLVADDDIQVLSALEAALRHKGHLVETASNGIDAAAKLETSAYPRSSRHHRLENAGHGRH
jgi:hypothetical protein